jgi:twitching motility protein PilT
VIVTGPTGSGKSTTLAAMIDLVNSSRDCHIITLEDPIEYLHKHKKSIVNQREIGSDTSSYASGLRAVLRQDPDVILIGEMRDLESISIALTAAETGHLVFSTLHTIGAAKTIDRIVDVFPPHQQAQIRVQLSMALQAVISQQLMPTADGRGRVPAVEVMMATPAIRNLVREGKTPQINNAIMTAALAGMQTMDMSLAALYKGGKITLDDCISCSVEQENIRRLLNLR